MLNLKIKKISSVLAFLTFGSVFFNTILQADKADTESTDYSFDDFGQSSFDLGELNLGDIENYETRTGTPDPTDSDINDIAFFLRSVVKAPLWNKTNAPAGRDMLYELPYKISAIQYGGFAFNVYFNTTNRMKVTAGDLFNVDAVQKENLDIFIREVFEGEDTAEMSQLIPLFRHVTLQERRAGCLFQGGFVKGPFSLQLHTSLQMAERNFWLTTAEQDEIKETFAKNFPGNSGFDRKELYKIRYGLGDTRIKFGLNTLNMSSFQIDFGLEAIVPTSRLSYSPRYDVSVDTVMDKNTLKATAIPALRGSRDYLIDPRLGNGGHFGIGCYCETKTNMFHDIAQLWTRFSFDKLLPCDEDKLFLFKKTLVPDDLKTSDTDLLRIRVNEYIKEYLFPTSFKSKVYPGGVFNAVVSLSTKVKKIGLALGYDFFTQQPEKIKKIYNTSVTLQDLRVEDTQIPRIIQNKIFAEAMYMKKIRKTDFGFGLGGDTTVHSTGMGYDWTLYGKITSSF